ncbi:MAG: hypothetical protein NVS2B3_13860 [Vulcanimicrobiaceae bacterium]
MCQAIFEITWNTDRHCTVAIAGDVDCDRVETLRDALAAVRAGEPRSLVFDLRTLRYACVPAYNFFITAAARQRDLGGCVVRFTFAEPSIHARVLALLGVASQHSRTAYASEPDEIAGFGWHRDG